MRLENIRSLISDDEAVSPVIGVILMVAITVILAAVIGTFVLGLGNQVTGSTAPTADFSFDYNPSASSGDGAITVVHSGGDKINDANIGFTLSDGTANVSKSIGGDGEWSAGDSANVTKQSSGAPAAYEEGETLRVTWTSEGGGSSQTLASFSVPSDASSL